MLFRERQRPGIAGAAAVNNIEFRSWFKLDSHVRILRQRGLNEN